MTRWLGIGALVLIGILVVVIIGQCWVIDHRDAALASVTAAEEAYRLDARGAVVARQLAESSLRSVVEDNAALREAAARIATVAPHAQTIAAVSHRGTAAEITAPAPRAPSTGWAVAASPPAPAPPLFRMRCDTDLVAARTKAGNIIVDGVTRLVRELPPPEELILADGWTRYTSVAWVAEPAERPVRALRGWGIAAAALYGSDGLRPGFGLATPEWAPKIGRWQPSVGAIGTVHAGSVYVAAVVRF